ncbi:MAG: succinate dehydrogenase, hydrophobic membrane anchor protein [Micavibrio sp.]|nr:MAG: succinate dehydrogenase, hydrophobic membrane anchor protein [Micavibrio sp.]
MSHKWEAGGMKNPLARARGLGSAHHGVGNWIRLRVTAVANVILSVWFIWFVKSSIGLDHAEFTGMLANPLNAIAMILLVISVFYHATLGCREIVEDYFHVEWMKISKLVGIYLFFLAAGIACIFSVLKIAL